jgi:ankyrin repeat protein
MNEHTAGLIDRCWRACYHDGDVAAVKSFLASGVDINAPAPCSGAAPLDAAIYGGHVDLIRYLVNAGANVNGVGYEDATALMAAAYQGDADTARLLLARGADPLVVHTERQLAHWSKSDPTSTWGVR